MRRNDYRYSISPAGHSRKSFILRAGPQIMGELSVRKIHGGEAVIAVDGAELRAFRTSILRKSLALSRRTDSEALCFTADMLSRGEIEAAGKKYCWEPANLNWTAWAWRGPQGRDLMLIKLTHGLGGTRGKVYASEKLAAAWQKELALLGWYLLLLDLNDFGAHFLSALQIAGSRI